MIGGIMAGSFSLSVGQWAKDASEEMKQLHKAIILELFSSVILDTPVLTGRLRGNWIISSDAPETGQFDVIDPTGAKATKKVEDFVSSLDLDDDFEVFLANNLPYAYRIEYDGWSKTKAPEGMVRKNLIRITNNLRA